MFVGYHGNSVSWAVAWIPICVTVTSVILSLTIPSFDVNMWAVENVINNAKSKMNELAVENTLGICVSVLKDRPHCLVNVVAFSFICNLMAKLYFHRHWNSICHTCNTYNIGEGVIHVEAAGSCGYCPLSLLIMKLHDTLIDTYELWTWWVHGSVVGWGTVLQAGGPFYSRWGHWISHLT
jgi:hypothetical protein